MARLHVRKINHVFDRGPDIYMRCHFGYYLLDMQIYLKYFYPSISRRIEFRHVNLLLPLLFDLPITLISLTLERLPFDDNEFDFVHLFSLAFCVPEDKVRKIPCEYDPR